MKLVIFIGDHPRHVFYAAALCKAVPVAAIVQEQREDVLPVPPEGLEPRDRDNFIRHFQDRLRAEQRFYGSPALPAGTEVRATDFPSLNTDATVRFVRRFEPSLVMIFGTGLIKEPLLSALPAAKINLHLGLSPYYKGSATLSGLSTTWSRISPGRRCTSLRLRLTLATSSHMSCRSSSEATEFMTSEPKRWSTPASKRCE